MREEWKIREEWKLRGESVMNQYYFKKLLNNSILTYLPKFTKFYEQLKKLKLYDNTWIFELSLRYA